MPLKSSRERYRTFRDAIATGTVFMALTLAGVVGAAGQSLDEARSLYAAASYTEALGVLSKLESGDQTDGALRDVLTFRALCLLALERPGEARQAVERMVSADPLYTPDPVETPPQLRELFRLTRERQLPAIVRERYAAAKQSLEQNQASVALKQFDAVLALLDAPDTVAALGAELSTDLRLLSRSFRDLAQTKSAAPERAETPADTASAPPATVQPLSDPQARSPQPAATSGVTRIFGADDADVIPPVPVRQTFPQARAEWIRISSPGLLEVIVSESGQVESAVLSRSVHPSYNNLLLQETTFWRYKPAMLHGVPVKYRRLIEITVTPPQR